MSAITLIDGTEVANDSEAWRAETEARAVLAKPVRADRIAYLALVEQRRGKPAADKLKADILRLWQRNQNP